MKEEAPMKLKSIALTVILTLTRPIAPGST
jgi:hypothetical protein